MASIERSLWRPRCLHSATTATLEPPWQWFCLHSAFFVQPVVPLQQLWSFKEGTRVVLQQLHRNRTFWVPATTERPNHFYGRTKVARRSHPCVKGVLVKEAAEVLKGCLVDNIYCLLWRCDIVTVNNKCCHVDSLQWMWHSARQPLHSSAMLSAMAVLICWGLSAGPLSQLNMWHLMFVIKTLCTGCIIFKSRT